ncbi:MAG: hypothetical protein U5R48_18075 [Gammaproteobacteria bacterium]|nr:hypothetical protein [Gammaproteobacteria bacterium]
MTLLRLEPALRDYAWGDAEFIPRLLGRETRTAGPVRRPGSVPIRRRRPGSGPGMESAGWMLCWRLARSSSWARM